MSACPKCGYQNLQLARFCQSCGTPLPPQSFSQTFTPTPVPHYYQQPKSGLSSPQIVIIVVVLVAVLVVGAVATAFYFFYAPFSQISRVSPGPGPVQVTGFFLAIIYRDSSQSYFGPTYRFLSVPGPMFLQHGEIFRSNFTLTLGGMVSHSVDSTTLGFSQGFTLQSISPNPLLTMSPGSATTFTATLQAPNVDFRGTVTIDLFTH